MANENARADFTGNDLHTACMRASIKKVEELGSVRSDVLYTGHCIGMISSLIAVGSYLQGNFRFCPSKDSSVVQASKIFVKFLNDNPERLHEVAILLMIHAFTAAFPCKQ
jgi:hypothetical protein